MKTILVTGATDGIGLGAAKALAQGGHRVLLHGRNADKLAAVRAEIADGAPGAALEIYQADLSNPQEVVAMANAVAANEERLDALVNNAGVLKTPQPITPNGHDARFMVNTFAPVILARRLMPCMAKDGRVVNLSSAAQRPVTPALLKGEQTTSDDFEAYAQSKLALTMWSRWMAARYPEGPSFYAVNPGSLLATNMVVKGFGMKGSDVGIGIRIVREAAVGASFEGHSGEYFDNDAGDWAPPHADALDDAKCDAVIALIEGELEKLGAA